MKQNLKNWKHYHPCVFVEHNFLWQLKWHLVTFDIKQYVWLYQVVFPPQGVVAQLTLVLFHLATLNALVHFYCSMKPGKKGMTFWMGLLQTWHLRSMGLNHCFSQYLSRDLCWFLVVADSWSGSCDNSLNAGSIISLGKKFIDINFLNQLANCSLCFRDAMSPFFRAVFKRAWQ